MDVLFHLTTLIKAHKEVGIPGLGTIYKKKSPGRYDLESHSFLPPSYLINFTSDLKEDALLTSLISKEENISADAAVHHIEEFSQYILDQLADHQTVSFGELGDFSIETGSLTFTSKKDQHFGFEFYGLPALSAELAPDQEIHAVYEEPVHTEVTTEQLDLEDNNADLGDGATTIEEEVQLPPFVETPENIELEEDLIEEDLIEEDLTEENFTEEEIPAEEETAAETTEEIVESAETPKQTEVIADPQPEPHFSAKDDSLFVFTSESTENKSSASSFYINSVVTPEQKPPAYRKLLMGIAIICTLVALFFLLKPELFKGIIPHQEHNTIDTPQTVQKPVVATPADSTAVVDTASVADSIRISNERAIAKIDSAKKTVPVAPQPDNSSKASIQYEILAASLANQKEADNFLADMKKRGIPAKVADLKGRRIKITLGTFTDEQEAQKQLQILKEKTKLPGIYIFTNRHTKQH